MPSFRLADIDAGAFYELLASGHSTSNPCACAVSQRCLFKCGVALLKLLATGKAILDRMRLPDAKLENAMLDGRGGYRAIDYGTGCLPVQGGCDVDLLAVAPGLVSTAAYQAPELAGWAYAGRGSDRWVR